MFNLFGLCLLQAYEDCWPSLGVHGWDNRWAQWWFHHANGCGEEFHEGGYKSNDCQQLKTLLVDNWTKTYLICGEQASDLVGCARNTMRYNHKVVLIQPAKMPTTGKPLSGWTAMHINHSCLELILEGLKVVNDWFLDLIVQLQLRFSFRRKHFGNPFETGRRVYVGFI